MKTREEIAEWEKLYHDEIVECKIEYGEQFDTLTYKCKNKSEVIFKRIK